MVKLRTGTQEDLGNEGLGRHIHGYGLLEVVTAKRPAEGVAWNWVSRECSAYTLEGCFMQGK